jgi:predicted adenylyl cyclase CyaB
MREVERKAWVSDPGGLEARLSASGGLVCETVKEDRYYLVGWSRGCTIDFGRDPIFRVRSTGSRAFLGWKDRTFVGTTEVNDEREIEVGDAARLIEWLESYLGLVPFVIKRKRTRLYALAGRFAPARVELNHVEGLGHFVEVEVMAGDGEEIPAVRLIDDVFEMLCIPEADVETRYYIDMLMHGASRKVVTI